MGALNSDVMESSKLPGSRSVRTPGSAPHHTLLDGPTATIVVGGRPTETRHCLPRALLCHYSNYFQKALSGCFLEAETSLIYLEDEDPALFDRVVRWLMTGTLFDYDSDTLKDLKEACSIWMFADRRLMPALQNSAIDAFREIDMRYWYWDKSIIRYVFDNTTANAAMRLFIVENFVNTACSDFFDMGSETHCGASNGLPQEFWRLALTTFFRVAEQGGRPRDARKWLRRLDTCRFHSHERDITCRRDSSQT